MFIVVLVATGLLYRELLASEKQDLQAHFEDAAQSLADRIEQRGQRYDRVLRSVSGLSPHLLKLSENRVLESYVTTLDIEREYPGIASIGLAASTAQPGKTSATTAIVQIAPDRKGNLALLGLDPYAEPLRRDAMLRSAELNQPVLTGLLSGLQPLADRSKVPNFEMFMPIYRPVSPDLNTVDWRQKNMLGWAFFSLNIADLIRGVVESKDDGLALDIYDGDVVSSTRALMFSTDSMNQELRGRLALFDTTKSIRISGHVWTMSIHSLPTFEAALDTPAHSRVMRNGPALAFLLALITWLIVNAQKQAQAIANKLTYEVQMLARAVGQSPVATLITDTEGRIEFVSEHFFEMSGYTSEELIGQRASLFKSGKMPLNVYQDLWETVKAGRVWKGTLQNRTKNGAIYWESQIISAIKNEQGEIVNFIAAKEDITQRKQAQEALTRNEAFTHSIMNSITDEIVVLDLKGVILSVNQPWRRLAIQHGTDDGKPAPHAGVGESFVLFCQVGRFFALEEDAMNARAGIQAVLAGSLAHFTLEYVCHASTQQLWFSLNASPLGSDSRGVVISHANITDRKNIEAAFFTHQENLEVMVDQRTVQLRALGMELLKSETRERRAIAEDLHDDLGQILAVAKLKLSSVEVPADGEVQAVVQRQLTEIESLIDRSSRSVRSLSTQLSPPALFQSGLCAALEWLSEEMMRTYGLHVRLDLGQIPPLDEAISSALFRTVRELLINIWKHAQVSEAEVTLAMDASRNTLLISVDDSGVGFDVANRLKPSEKQSYGLFSIRERLTFIGGSMNIDSRQGTGTTVVLSLSMAHFKR